MLKLALLTSALICLSGISNLASAILLPPTPCLKKIPGMTLHLGTLEEEASLHVQTEKRLLHHFDLCSLPNSSLQSGLTTSTYFISFYDMG